MKKLLFIFGFIALILGFKSPVDDTAAVQALVNSTTNASLSARTYIISGTITIPSGHNLDMTAANINCALTSGPLFRLLGSNTLQGGTLTGSWNPTTSIGTVSAVVIQGSSITVTGITLRNFSLYGVVCNANVSHVSITHNSITNTGLNSIFYNSNANGATDVHIDYNNIDRSAIPASTVTEAAIILRAANGNDSASVHYYMTNSSVNHNQVIMPLNPSSAAAECHEMRQCDGCQVIGNNFTNSSIGISFARCRNIICRDNKVTNAKLEAFEIGHTYRTKCLRDTVIGTPGDGFLFDGYLPPAQVIGSNTDTLAYCYVRGAAYSAVHTGINTRDIVLTRNDLQCTKFVIDMQSTTNIHFDHNKLDGLSGSGSVILQNDIGLGRIYFTHDTLQNASFAVKSYNVTTGAVVDSILGLNCKLTSITTQFGSFFLNGAHYGPDVRFYYTTLSFPAIAGKIYGASDFDPGATSALSIIYSSANTAIATIVSNKVHIVKVGTVNITASNGDTSAVQPVTISKTPLTIYADNHAKTVGSANPALTATFYGFVNGETNSILTAQPALSTAAGTSSPAGVYAISISGATAVNYTITQVAGVLTIKPLNTAYGPVIYIKAVVLK